MIDCEIKRHILELQRYAKENKLNRNQISKMIGVTAMTMGLFFTDKWNPKLSTLLAIEKAFKKHKNKG